MKGVQPVPTLITRAVGARPESDVWMRAMVLAPNSYRFMLATVIGEPDMTAMRTHFVKPETAIAAAFAEDATPGLRCDHFTGSAFATLPRVSFRMQTAALR
jgi:hypothetical protein